MKVILNKCYGGFGVSQKGYELYAKKKNLSLYMYKRSNDDFMMFEKISKDENVLLTHYFTVDMGDSFSIHSMKNWNGITLYLDESHRTDSVLIEVVEELGKEANGEFADLQIVEIPDDMEYEIIDHDGIERLCEVGKTW
jgi:hypothetical protein